MNTALLTNFALATLAILNPLGKVPVWLSLTGGESSNVRHRLAVWMAITVLALLVGTFLLGHLALDAFGIDLAAFRLAGGILMLLLGISMIRGEIRLGGDGASEHKKDIDAAVRARYRDIVVPFAMPILAGPGALCTMIMYEAQAGTWLSYGCMLGVIVLVVAALLAVLRYAEHAQRVVGDLGLELATRLFGLILTAIAVQFMVEALGEIFPKWIDWTSPISDDINESSTGGESAA